MSTILDQDETGEFEFSAYEIKTPVDAERHYLPLLIKGKYDLMQIKKELREVHSFSEEDVRISARVIANGQLDYVKKNPTNNFSKYLVFVLGFLIFAAGLIAVLFLWDNGVVAVLPFFVISAGVTLIVSSKVRFGQKR